MKLLINIVFFILFTITHFGGERFKWTEVNVDETITGFRIIDADSKDNIWLYDSDYNLYTKTKDKWKRYNSPFEEELKPAGIIKIDSNKFFAWALDKNYFSHIRIFEKNKWSDELNHVIKYPLIGVIKNDKNDYLNHGNFGTLIRLKNNIYTAIKNPFKNHIWSALKSKNGTIWLGGKYDGIYKYQNNRFTKMEFADNSNYEIRFLKEKNGTIYAYHNEYNFFELRGNNFVKIKKSFDEIFENNRESKIGITSYSYLKDEKKIKVSYPTKLKPQQIFTVSDSLIYLVTKSKLLRGTKYNHFYFDELASSYLISGAEQTDSRQAFVNDFNNDGFNDLLVLNNYPQELNSLYAGNYSFPFQERLFKLDNTLTNLSSRVFKFADLNKDYFDDVIVSINDSNGTGISIYWNNKDFTFSKHIDLYSPQYLRKSPIKNIETVDIDNDGDLDINLSYYYGKEDNPGNDIFYYNKFNGQLFDCDTSYKELTRGWNNKSTFADVDNDGDLDWYISLLWWKDRLFLNRKGRFVNVSTTHLKNTPFLNTTGTIFSDIDNDGDLDLIRTCDEQLIAISLNNGNGYFTDATDSLINKNISLNLFTYQGYKSVNTLDINNDSFTDILLTTNFSKENKTILLINEKGKSFSKYSDFGLDENESFYTSSITDIDYDGDLDIYLIKESMNHLLINNLDDDNYLRIKLVGVSSSTSAQNSKIWVYNKGGLNKRKSLVAYRETGINNSSSTHKNENVLHFGLDSEKEYDVKIKFQSGTEKILRNIKPPDKITVFEHEGIYKHALLLSTLLFNLILNREIQYYAAIIILTIIILGISIRYGHEKFNWGIRLSLSLAFVNFSLFWIILLLAYSSTSIFIKFIFPILTAFSGAVLPILIFFSIKTNIVKRNLIEYKDELLNQIINFSHGEWALKNINGLIFLLQSIPSDISNNQKYKAQLKERINTYNSLTSKSIEKIISLSKQIDFDNTLTKLLMQTTAEISKLNKKIESENFSFDENEKKLFTNLKAIIRTIRNNIILEYSCNPIEVIDFLLETNKSFIKESKTSVEFIYPSDLKKNALIKSNELADIIDNSIVNAVRSFSKQDNRIIIIEVKWIAPKFRVTIKDNGERIYDDYKAKIFEKGFSTRGSSGIGLFNSRNTLRKYSGRIILQSSDEKWTTFLIELNEGFIDETEYSNN